MKRIHLKHSIDLVEGEMNDIFFDWENGNVIGVGQGDGGKVLAALNSGDYDENMKRVVAELVEKDVICFEEENEKKQKLITQVEETMGVVYFMPSMMCNFRCKYCFEGDALENDSARIMSKELIIQSVKFIYDQAEKLKLTKLKVILFGGEPTLYIDKHIEFMQELNKIMKKCEVEYDLITNGYIVQVDKIGIMKTLGLNNIQITLDGTKDVHDKRRVLKNGNKTFDRIFKNIKLLCENHFVSIRVNIDEENCYEIKSLIEELAQNGLNDKIYLQFVPVDPSSFSQYSGYSEKVLSKFDEIYYYAFLNGFHVGAWNRGCSVRNKMFMAIDPCGDIYKCPSFVGNKDSIIGNVCYGYNKKYSIYINKEYKSECKCCKYFLYCRGGCEAIREINGPKNSYCIKYALEKIHLSYIRQKYNLPYEVLRRKKLESLYRRQES